MKRLMIVVISLFLLQSCEKKRIDPSSVEGKLAAKINAMCQASKACTVRVSDLTEFSWDTMCVFKYTATTDEIGKVVGSSLPEYDEFTRKSVFMKEGKVVYSEQNPTDVEKPINGEVVFDIPDDAMHKCYDRNSVFNVNKRNTSVGAYYELRLIG